MASTVTERKLLLNGEWVETGDWVEVASPYDGSLVARVPKAGADEARAAIDAAEAAMREPLPAHKRAEILVRVAGALGRRADEAAVPLLLAALLFPFGVGAHTVCADGAAIHYGPRWYVGLVMVVPVAAGFGWLIADTMV